MCKMETYEYEVANDKTNLKKHNTDSGWTFTLYPSSLVHFL